MADVPALLEDIAKRKGNQLRRRMEIANSSKQKQRRVISLGGLGGGEKQPQGLLACLEQMQE